MIALSKNKPTYFLRFGSHFKVVEKISEAQENQSKARRFWLREVDLGPLGAV
jgi:hypothetical protein